jgi:phosphatidylserine decarboxylase
MMIVRDGIPFVLAGVAVTIAAAVLLHPYLAIPGGLICLFFLNFFRDPERSIPDGDVVVSPADGKVIVIRRLDGSDHPFVCFVSIFMNVFDVHVNRSPISGRLESYEYAEGRFLPADDESASVENEHNRMLIADGPRRVRMSQVAGLIARRIVCWKSPGDCLVKGERIGLIQFGSRVDLWLPAEAVVKVRVGQTVKAGQTILAEFNDGRQ